MRESSQVQKHFLALSGSLRSGSTNTALLHAAAMLAPSHIQLTVYDGIPSLPHFDPDQEECLPPSVQSLRQLLCGCDAILIAATSPAPFPSSQSGPSINHMC